MYRNKFDFMNRSLIRKNKLKKLAFATANNCSSGAYFDDYKNRYVKINGKSKKYFKKLSNHKLKNKLNCLDSKINSNYDNYTILNNKKNYDLWWSLY